MELDHQVAIVTGGGSGLGRAMALRLAAEGVSVLISEVREDVGANTESEINEAGGRAALFTGDVSDEAVAEKLIEFCLETFGRLDILINNAGIRMEFRENDEFEDWRCLPRRPTHEVSVDDWDLVLRVNLRAAYLCTHYALPHMIEQGSGVVIGVSSDAGSKPAVGKCAYVASKFGLEGLMKTVAEEMREHGISANAIYPGGRADVDGRGGLDPDVMTPLVMHLCRQNGVEITGQSITAREWNQSPGSVE
ncbi:MAG: SDR family oxidoreductase [Rhodospirillaceae bacterium]